MPRATHAQNTAIHSRRFSAQITTRSPFRMRSSSNKPTAALIREYSSPYVAIQVRSPFDHRTASRSPRRSRFGSRSTRVCIAALSLIYLLYIGAVYVWEVIYENVSKKIKHLADFRIAFDGRPHRVCRGRPNE